MVGTPSGRILKSTIIRFKINRGFYRNKICIPKYLSWHRVGYMLQLYRRYLLVYKKYLCTKVQIYYSGLKIKLRMTSIMGCRLSTTIVNK